MCLKGLGVRRFSDDVTTKVSASAELSRKAKPLVQVALVGQRLRLNPLSHKEQKTRVSTGLGIC